MFLESTSNYPSGYLVQFQFSSAASVFQVLIAFPSFAFNTISLACLQSCFPRYFVQFQFSSASSVPLCFKGFDSVSQVLALSTILFAQSIARLASRYLVQFQKS